MGKTKSSNKRRRSNNRGNKLGKYRREKLEEEAAKKAKEDAIKARLGVEPQENQAVEDNFTEDVGAETRKRELVDDDSDNEQVPKKKKKKKQPMPTDSTENKSGKKSNRQIKKEKHLQRQADEQAAAKEQVQSGCLSYISQWKHNRPNWKFMKAKQVWLNKNKFSSSLVPDATWTLLVEYFEGAKGNIRNVLLEDATTVIKQMDEWMEKNNGAGGEDNKTLEDEEDTDTTRPDEIAYKRARDLIQRLSE